MAQREQVFVGQPQTFGGARLLPSPSQFFLTGEDRLRVVSANSLTGVSLKVQWRTATLAGDVVPSSQDHTPNSDRTVKRQDYELGSGSLLNVTVFASAGAPVIGQTYVLVQIVRGEGLAAIVLGTILAGYVTAVQALGFPGSPIVASTDGEPYVRHIVGTAPGAGLNIAETVPTGARWEVVTLYAPATWSAVAGNRTPYLVMSSAGVNIGTFAAGGATPAAAVVACTWGQTLGTGADNTNHQYQGSLPAHLTLIAGAVIQTAVFGLAAGDAWGNPQYTVREWLEVA
jgi:hypothetical protein